MEANDDLICDRCIHRRIYGGGCDAFPVPETDGIPREILGGENNHSKPLPDQGNDIVFEEGEPNDN